MSTVAAAPPRVAPAGTGRARVVAVALALGAAANGALSVWQPTGGAESAYAIVAPMREAWWAWSVVGGLLGIAVLAVALSLAACLLAPDRGAGWATAGAVLTTLGGLAAYGGVAADGILYAYLTDPAVVDPAAATPIVAAIAADPSGDALLLPAYLLFIAGSLVLALALWRARTVPRWLTATFAALNVLGVLIPEPRLLLDTVNVGYAATMAGIAVVLWRTR